MKKTFTLLAITLAITFGAQAQPIFQWARSIIATSHATGRSVTVDVAGNVYSTGYFSGTADFDPGTGTYNLTSAGNADIFVSKLDASGNFVWAKQFGGTLNDEGGTSIAVDASGNVYTTGRFLGTADFDPGVGTYNLISVGDFDIYISKLDAAGNFVWAKQFGGPSTDIGNSIAVDAAGNVYSTGQFIGTVDFDPGAGTYNFTSSGNTDIYISKLDAAGNFVWAKLIGGANSDIGNSITVDASGNIYTTGLFLGTVDFDPGAGTFNLNGSTTSADIFVSKLDASGDFVWAKRMGGGNADVGESIAVDAAGNVYTTGYFSGAADFDPGAGTYNFVSSGDYDIFISKLDASGNFLWAKQFGGIKGDYGFSIALDASGNVYSTGRFQGTVDFEPGAGTYNLTSAGAYDIFISKLDASGNFGWVLQLGGTASDVGNSIFVDASGNVYTTGQFLKTVDFDPGPGTYNLTSGKLSTIDLLGVFVQKMGSCISGGSLVVTALRDTICAGTPGILNVTNNPGSIQWQSSVTAGNFKNISGATIGNYVSQDTISTYFRVYSSSSSCADTSAAFALIVKQSPVADFLSNGTGTQISFTDKSKGATVYNWDFGDTKTSTEQNPVHTYTSKGTYHVCLTVLNGSNCSFTICRDIDVDITTEVRNINAENKIIISPNPFSNTITIEQTDANNPIQSIEVYDLLGKKVYEQVQTSNLKPETETNLSDLVSGMYFVKIKTKNADYLERIIKQ